MTEEQVLAAFVAVVRRLADDPDMAVAPGTDLTELGGLDSLRLLEAIALTESACGVEIDAATMGDFTVVADVLRAVLAAGHA